MPFSAFLSYARANIGAANKIRTKLSRVGLPAFQDVVAIEGGQEWREEIEKGLRDCDAIVVLVSRDVAASNAVLEEVRIATALRCVVIPFLLEPFSSIRGTQLAELLEGHQWIDASVEFEEGAYNLVRTLQRRNRPQTPVVAVSNLKGGVGKTTLAAHIFSALYRDQDLSVCLVDLDPQSNLSQFVLREGELEELRRYEKSIISFFERGSIYGAPSASAALFDMNLEPIDPKHFMTIPHYIEDGKTKKLALVCGQFEIIKYTLSQNAEKLETAKQNFRKAIFEARRNFDLVVIDLNPSSSFLIECALTNCTHILCPVRPDKYSLQGIGALRSLIQRAYGIDRDRNLVLVMNGVEWASVSDAEKEIKDDPFYGPLLLGARIPQTDMLVGKHDEQALDFLSLSRFFGRGRYGGQLKARIAQAAEEVMARIRKT